MLTFALAGIMITREVANYTDNLEKEIAHFQTSHQGYLSSLAWSMEYKSLVNFANYEATSNFVQYVKIVDSLGKVIAEAGHLDGTKKRIAEFNLTYFHNGRDFVIGHITIGGSIPSYREWIRTHMSNLLLTSGLLVLVTFSFSYLLFHRQVLSRLAAIKMSLQDNSFADADDRNLPGNTFGIPDEITLLVKTLANRTHQTREELQKRREAEEKLQKMNADLLLEIEERQRVEQVLESSREKYRLLVENQTDLLVKVDLQGQFEFVSQSYCRLFGKTESELLNNSFMPMVHPDDHASTANQIAKVFQPPYTAYMEQRARTVDGWRWLAWLDTAVLDDKGNVTSIIGVGRDITEQKEYEQALKETQKTFLSVLNGIDASVYVSDMETGEILFMNQYIIDLFGRDMTGEKCYKSFRNEDGPCPYCPKAKLVDDDGKPAGVHIWQDKNPITKKYFVNYDRAITWTDGRLVQLQIATDITELREIEQQLQQAQKMEAVGRLAGGVAHDFNNMLSIILGNSEMLLADYDLADDVVEHMHEIEKAARRSAALTRQLLAFARKQTVSPEVLDINQALGNALKMISRLIGEDIELVWNPGCSDCLIEMDPTQLDQLLTNLCLNARDAIDGVGRITIETQAVTLDEEACIDQADFVPGDYVVMLVSDTGSGMDEQTLANIFEPFFTTKSMDQGTGLGLATVYGVLKQNKGFVHVSSQPGEGSTFQLYLPRVVEGREDGEENTVKTTVEHGHETILLVEDEHAILLMTKRMLENLGYEVLAADSPQQAITMADEFDGRIHLLITDVVMPGMSGREMVDEILKSHPELKYLYVSGYTANVIAEQGILDVGVNFIQKPFSMADLSEKVRELIAMQYS